MTTRPVNASEIRYAVIPASFIGYEQNVRHDRLRDHFRREPYPQRDRRSSLRARSQIIASGPRANVDNSRRLPARSRAPANENARSQFPGAGFKILAMLSMYR
jgi:hypothetical protein